MVFCDGDYGVLGVGYYEVSNLRVCADNGLAGYEGMLYSRTIRIQDDDMSSVLILALGKSGTFCTATSCG